MPTAQTRRCRPSRSFANLGVLLLAAFAAPLLAFEQHTAHGGPIKGIALSADGKWLVSTSFDYSAVLWSLPALTERRRLDGHEAAVNTAAFSPDGRLLATAGSAAG